MGAPGPDRFAGMTHEQLIRWVATTVERHRQLHVALVELSRRGESWAEIERLTGIPSSTAWARARRGMQ